MLRDKKILLIVTGGVAAYKALELGRRLQELGAKIQPVLTENAKKFVTELSFSTLFSTRVYSDLFDPLDQEKIHHISLARDHDMIIVAPATANFIQKIGQGVADDLASCLVLVNKNPVFLVPSMNPSMYQNTMTQEHIQKLKKRDVQILTPEYGKTACGEIGDGRMQNIDDIVENIMHFFAPYPDMIGKKIIITAGPTQEPIDAVRYISNFSSGKQAYAVADYLTSLGAHVFLISGPVALSPSQHYQFFSVQTAKEMYDQTIEVLENNPIDAFIGIAAVADWRVKNVKKEKISKQNTLLPHIEFEENIDIIAAVGNHVQKPSLVIGFAAETVFNEKKLMEKKHRKKCDFLLYNAVKDTCNVFGSDSNEITFFDIYDQATYWGSMPKKDVAHKLAEHMNIFFRS